MGTVIPSNTATFDFDDFVRCVHGTVLNPGRGAPVVGVGTDSRRVQPGNAFVALSGERFDGHDHANSATEAGASVLLVSRPVEVVGPAVVRVEDTLEALGWLGREHRRRWASTVRARGWDGKVVGITGSAGKTTTCRATTAVLEAVRPGGVQTPAGNLNNAIGVPLVLLGLEERHGQAVVEIGTNSPGEIAYGSGLAEPDVGVMTLVACAHTEGLGSIEAVAEEKGALFASLRGDGVCVANADDPHVLSQVKRSNGARVLTFGTSDDADVRVIEATRRGWEGQDLRIEVRVGAGTKLVVASVPLLGAAGVYASAAALAVAWAVCGDDVDWEAATQGLTGLRAESGRLRPRTLGRGSIVIDDAYNANPASMRDSIDVAAKLAGDLGRRLVLVLGEMRELGAQSEREHRRVGEQVAGLKPEVLIAVGGNARLFAEASSSSCGLSAFAADAEAATGKVLDAVGEQDVILVKGSRGIALERVVAALDAWGEGQR